MNTTTISSIQHLDMIKSHFRENGYDFLMLAVARFADSPRLYSELNEYWSSIDNVTYNKIAFLHFTYDEQSSQTINLGNGQNIVSQGFASNYYSKLQPIHDLNRKNNYHIRDFLRIKLMPRLSDSVLVTLEESASQLLRHLGKKESEVPFMYFCRLRDNKVYYNSIEYIFDNNKNIFSFIKLLVIKIEHEHEVRLELNATQQIYNDLLNSFAFAKRLLEKKKIRINRLSEDIEKIERFTQISQNALSQEEDYYITSIISREKYTLRYPLKNKFLNYISDSEHINNIIIRHAEKNLIESEELEDITILENDIRDKELYQSHKAQSLKSDIVHYENILSSYYEHFFNSQIKSNIRKMSNNFKISLTFASESRPYVQLVAQELDDILGHGQVFYDMFYEGVLARMNLDEYLQDIYHNNSEFIVIFLSNDYEKKEWCGVEWRAIRNLIKKKQEDKIILVKLEDFSLSGVFSIDGYLDGIRNTPLEIARLIIDRIRHT